LGEGGGAAVGEFHPKKKTFRIKESFTKENYFNK